MMLKISLIFFFVLTALQLQAQTSVEHILCDSKTDPIGIDAPRPALSWTLTSKATNVLQTAYQVMVADDSLSLAKNIGKTWDSKKVISDKSIQIIFSGVRLEPAKTYYWKVRIWDNKGNMTAWSKPGKWQMGLLDAKDWAGAQWIAYNKMPDSLRIVPALEDTGDPRWNKGNDTLPLLRKRFTVTKKIKRATVFITGLGQFDLSLNGKKVGDHFLDPGWTQFDKHALYVSFDVTNILKSGDNVISVMLGNGFYYIPGDRYHKLKGAFGYPKMICRTLIEYADGSKENIISDGTWKAATGPITFSSIYGGEDYDATLKRDGWDTADFDDAEFQNAVIVDGPSVLKAQSEEPLKIFDTFKVQSITEPKPGVWVYDMGQNASAIPLLIVKGKPGGTVKITPAELLDSSGLAMQSPVGAPVFFNYTLNGKGTESWHPEFMYYGFRYLQVEGAVPENQENLAQLPVVISLSSLHTRNAAATIGSFQCSNELFNRIFNLINWAIKSNTASIFTDCPHREKLGWLEEAHLVGSSIRYNYDIRTLLRKVVSDMKDSQTSDGLIPDIAPEYVQFRGPFRDSPEWGSSGIILPWYLYQWYGDKQALENSYEMMTRYAAYLGSKAQNHILYFGLGDWYDLGPGDLGPSQLTPSGITSTAIYYYDLAILAKTAAILHKKDDEKKYLDLGLQVKEAYNQTFFNKGTNQYGTGSQTANAISLHMGLVDENVKDKVLDNLVQNIRDYHNGVTAGDIGFRYLLRVLDDAGRSDVIFDMNSRSDVPGYGYQLAEGATSLTESWQGNRISSNNHFMLGHLMEWFYSGLGGIKPAEKATAFKQIIIRPEVVGDVTDVRASFLSPYGLIKNEWSKKGDKFIMTTTVPVNTTATIYLPADKKSIIKENGRDLGTADNFKNLKFEGGKVAFKVGSGTYSFIVDKN